MRAKLTLLRFLFGALHSSMAGEAVVARVRSEVARHGGLPVDTKDWYGQIILILVRLCRTLLGAEVTAAWSTVLHAHAKPYLSCLHVSSDGRPEAIHTALRSACGLARHMQLQPGVLDVLALLLQGNSTYQVPICLLHDAWP